MSSKVHQLMRRISPALLVTALFLADGARGQDSPRPAWQWTEEERIAKRYDPSSMRSREGAFFADTPGPLHRGRDVVEGAKNPALFLPFELFQSLLMKTFSPLPEASQVFRDVYQERFGGAWFGDDFWQRLEQTARPYLDSIRTQRARAKEYQEAPPERRAEIDSQADELGQEACRLRVQSLETVRAAFGREAFDRFLYEAVAASMFHASVDSHVSADHLRHLAGGCQ